MMNRTLGIKRWVLIEAGPEVVFDYLTNLSSHEQWEEYSGFAVVEISAGPVVRGSSCRRERIETLQAPILRGGKASNQVTWTKNLTVVSCEPNCSLGFEIENLYNGLSMGSEHVSFRLFPEQSKTILLMTDKKNPHLPGPFYVIMQGIESLRSWIAQPVVGTLFWLVPCLRANGQLRRIKTAVERA